ncbi:MAG TPA: beta-ketoacyl synthase N-terminal-like domain-containing protein [Chthoniobacteraceae bacterium]
MTAEIAGLGWVTPLGIGLEEVWSRLASGEKPERKILRHPELEREHAYYAVPPKAVEHCGRNPRLRRSSAISYFAVAAGLAAMEHAGLKLTPEIAARTAVIFAISDGGVLYTRRFYEQLVKQGANTASPLLFPETVYNAPASHLAALLGIDGASYTLVGDSSVGLTALHFASQLLALGSVDHCVVVGAEECDWILCEAYRTWRLAQLPLAEGAAAVVLSRAGRWRVQTHPGQPFLRRKEAAAALDLVLENDAGRVDLVVASAGGSFVDRLEAAVLHARHPKARTFFPKHSLGEAPGASALIQTVFAALAVEKEPSDRALVSVIGFNHQANAAWISAK